MVNHHHAAPFRVLERQYTYGAEQSDKWQEKAGEPFRYYMVFREKAPEIDGAYTFDRFLEMLGKL